MIWFGFAPPSNFCLNSFKRFFRIRVLQFMSNRKKKETNKIQFTPTQTKTGLNIPTLRQNKTKKIKKKKKVCPF